MSTTYADARCLCGEPAPGRLHHYWECPLAEGVVRAIEAHLPPPGLPHPPGVRTALQPHHVWCMEPPRCRPRMHSGVWRVVCLAALNSMDYGRRQVYKLELARQEAARRARTAAEQRRRRVLRTGQLQLVDVGVTVTPRPSAARAAAEAAERQDKLEELGRVVVARFWSLLVDFVVVGAPPPQWLASLGPAHPFLHVNPTLTQVQLQHLAGVLSRDA